MTSIKNNPAPLTAKKKISGKANNPKKEVAKLSRWLHIYLSMVSFAIVLFFSVTGLTLNHPKWFGGDKQVETKYNGKLNVNWVNNSDTAKIARLEIVEFFRKKHNVKGFVSDIRIDEGEIILQGKFKIAENETPETLAQKVHQIEYEIFPKAIDLVLNKRVP